jgi:SRSO17 transposase
LLTEDDLQELLPELERFHARFGRFFPRSESRGWGQKYVAGLMLPIERKNVENLAERIGAPPRRLQQFVSESPWDDEGCMEELQRLVGEQIGEAGGVLVIDDTGFAKKGKHSAGVGRQYSGTLGRIDNCQIGVFLGYASKRGHTLVDRRLYLMESWFQGGESVRAGLPEGIGFMTKPELAREMLWAATEGGHLPYRWVTADAGYGESHDLRREVAELDAWYCFEVRSQAEVWAEDPGWQVLTNSGRGRPPSRPHPTPDSPQSCTVAELVATLPPEAWVRHRVTEGAKGPREYEFARVRVVEKWHRRIGPSGWMMARRGVGGEEREVKYYLSNAPEEVSLEEMAWVGCLRWTIEENFELAKGELGLDHYEVTKHRGWYHHVTLVLLALTFLKLIQRGWAGKKPGRQRAGDPSTAGGRAATGGLESSRRHRLVPRPAAPQARRSAQPPAPLVA